MSEKVNITSKGIQKVLKTFNEKQAVAEYIWNGFDAQASRVKIDYTFNELGRLDRLEISDNGYGINFDHLKQKFDPFFESEKSSQIPVPKHTSKMHGRNGVGRLTFFTFAHSATWTTTFKTDKGYQQGFIHINTGELNGYSHDFSQAPASNGSTGTKVSFTNLKISKEELERSVIPFLINEFCWFIELNRHKAYEIVVNGNALDFTANIKDLEEFELRYQETNVVFKVKYVQWQEGLHKELSKYYFLTDGEEVFKDYTTLNKKSDDYFHSVYIESIFFRELDFKSLNEGQVGLFGPAKSSLEYRFLINKLTEYLKSKRKPFLKEYANKLVDAFEQDGIFPKYVTDQDKQLRKPELTEVIKVLYEAEPKLFSGLNIDQKKTLVRFLDLLLISNERKSVFETLKGIVELEPEESESLADLLAASAGISN
jgi:hypothetical protein